MPMRKTGCVFLFLSFLLFCPCAPCRAAAPEDMKKAAALNRSASEKMRAGDLDGAEVDMLGALEYSGQNPKLKKNLGTVYFEKGARATRAGNFYDAEKYLNLALEITPDDPRYLRASAAAISLEADSRAKNGESDEALRLYQKAAAEDPQNASAWMQASHYAWTTQKLDQAREYLAKAKGIDPKNPGIADLENKMSIAGSEESAGRQTETSQHFILSAEAGGAAGKGAAEILEELEQVYSEVGYKLNYSAQNKITVVFYPMGEFHEHWRLPYRVNGYYDGKLRIPYGGKTVSMDTLKPMIRHELTHAFISAMAGHRPIPQWMNEGIAQWVEGREIDVKSKDAMVMYQLTGRVPDIAHLDGIFLSQRNPYNNTEMTLAYMKSLSLVQYLIQERGVWSLVQYIQDGDSALSPEERFKKYFLASSAEIEERWKRWIERQKSNYVFN